MDSGMTAEQWYEEYSKEHSIVVDLEIALKNERAKTVRLEKTLQNIREYLARLGADEASLMSITAYPEVIRRTIVKVVEADRERWMGEHRPPVPGEPVYLKTTFEVR